MRDYFYQSFADVAGMHDAIRKQLASLTERPGTELPLDRNVLNLLEELIYHSISAGKIEEARLIYEQRLGGAWHLARRLGEFARGHRILRQFPYVFDYDGLLRYRRGIGDLPSESEWLENNDHLTFFSSLGMHDTLLLLGELPRLSSSEARFLMGEARPPNVSIDYAPRFSAITRYYGSKVFVSYITPPNEAVRELWRADACIRKCELVQARTHVESASSWILSSGSQEHLCILHLVRSRLAIASNDWTEAESAITEGLQIAANCKFRIFQIDILIEQARLMGRRGNDEHAQRSATEALELACDPKCRYAWGELDALECLSLALHNLNLRARGEQTEQAAAVLRAKLQATVPGR